MAKSATKRRSAKGKSKQRKSAKGKSPRKLTAYQRFVKNNMKSCGNSMAAVAEKWNARK
jgi:hypothetical protein